MTRQQKTEFDKAFKDPSMSMSTLCQDQDYQKGKNVIKSFIGFIVCDILNVFLMAIFNFYSLQRTCIMPLWVSQVQNKMLHSQL